MSLELLNSSEQDAWLALQKEFGPQAFNQQGDGA
jgi:hypothetical protein